MRNIAVRSFGFKSSLYTLWVRRYCYPKPRLLIFVFSLSQRVHAGEGDHSELRSPLSPSPCDPILFRTRFKPKQTWLLVSLLTVIHSRTSLAARLYNPYRYVLPENKCLDLWLLCTTVTRTLGRECIAVNQLNNCLICLGLKSVSKKGEGDWGEETADFAI